MFGKINQFADKMLLKTVLLCLGLVAGSLAVPASLDQPDYSVFFDHTDAAARIVGGTVAADGSVPYMAALSSGLFIRSLVCGSSIITPRTLLTAAHCIDAVFSWNSLSSSLRATVGTNRWNLGGVSYSIERNVTHEHYVSATIKNDIGILITSSAIVLTDAIKLVPLSFEYVPGGVRVRAAGWGRIRGDSGSALVRIDRGEQVAAVSWGFPCALGAPDMFVRISAYRDWLARHTVV